METEHVISSNTATDPPWAGCMAFALLILQFFFYIPVLATAGDFVPSTSPPDRMNYAGAPESFHFPVYRIPLRVHLGKSGRRPADFREILDEINDIWLSQAGICFEIETVADDVPCEEGMDLWFSPVLTESSELNGYYGNDHEIHVRDTPVLGPAERPARHPAARTAAHECGHGLGLAHRQDSDDNLMRSKTYGWRLNVKEVMDARKSAASKALPDISPLRCGPPRIEP